MHSSSLALLKDESAKSRDASSIIENVQQAGQRSRLPDRSEARFPTRRTSLPSQDR